MNTLEQFLHDRDIDEAKAMDELQLAGVVSDCAVWAKDVASCDCEKAVSYLRTWALKAKTDAAKQSLPSCEVLDQK